MRLTMRAVWGCGVVLLLAACQAAPATLPPLPTQALLPATPTVTATPVTPTATPPAGLLDPAEFGATPLPAEPAPAAALPDPVAAQLALLAAEQLAASEGVPATQVRLIAAQPVTWAESSLGCPRPGQTYAALTAAGYRLVMGVGAQRFVFHTDFERVLRCDPADEVLPEGVATPTRAPTATLDAGRGR